MTQSRCSQVSPVMLRVITSANWRGILPGNAPRNTVNALIRRDLADIEQRRWRRDRVRLTVRGWAVLNSQPTTPDNENLGQAAEAIGDLGVAVVGLALAIAD